MAAQTLTAQLVMESKGLAPAVRSAGVHNNWSKLYQADQYHLDLMLNLMGDRASLLGQVLTEDGKELEGSVELYRDDTCVSPSVSVCHLGSEADFFIEIEQAGGYVLRVNLPDTTLVVNSVHID